MNIYPRENYWRSGWNSDEFHRCRLLGVCLGGVDTYNYQGECEKGYKGVLCTVCEDNWARLGTYGCTLCHDNEKVYYALIITFIVALFSFSLYVLKSNIQTA